MPPKSKKGFKLKSLFGFGSSQSKGEDGQKGAQQWVGIAAAGGIPHQVSHPSGGVTTPPSPIPHLTSDVLAVRSDLVGPQELDLGPLIGTNGGTIFPHHYLAPPSPPLLPQPTFKLPDCSPSFLANANNFQLQNLNYFQSVQGSIALGGSGSPSAGAAAGS
jgi:hypothetical protein